MFPPHTQAADWLERVLYTNRSEVFFEIGVFEAELGLLALAPTGAGLVVEVEVGALFVFVGDLLGLLVALYPGQVLLVVAPGLGFELLGGQIRRVGALLIIKDVEQGVDVELLKGRQVVEQRQWLLGG